MEKIEKISAVVISVMVVVSGIASTAIAYDANNPWTGTVKWSIPSDTSFTVTFAGSQTQINFTASGKNDTLIEPDGQDAVAETPIITIENTGNTNLNFKCNLTSAKPSWVTHLKVCSTPFVIDATDFNTTLVLINSSIAPGESTPMYLWSYIENAPAGTTTRTLMIVSEQSA